MCSTYLLKNPRDQLGMRNLLLQAFPTCWQDTMDVYQKVTERPFGYMVLDLHPGSDGRSSVLSHEVQQFPDRGKSETYAENAAFNALLPLWRGRLRRTNLERLKWIHRIKLDTVHRKVMKTLRRFIDEDDMEFDEAAESAVIKRKFLLNRIVKEKVLPTESDDDEEAEEEAEASVSYSESTT